MSLRDEEMVIPTLAAWQRAGKRTALVTVVGIEGPAPRPLGAQMAVANDGAAVGYLSGGCLEQAVALEAQAVIRSGVNRLVRYGRGSPYFDLKLPCGSGLDLYFDQALAPSAVDVMLTHARARRVFALSTDLDSGESAVLRPSEAPFLREGDVGGARRDGATFQRVYLPAVKLLLVGAGPALLAIARLASSAGLELDILTPDDAARAALDQAGIGAAGLTRAGLPPGLRPDAYTAAVLAFHEHDWEAPLLAEIVQSQAFFIGAMGNRGVHQARLTQLREAGVSDRDLARIRPTLGVIAGAKSQVTLAVGILADVLSAAKQRGIVD